MAWFAVHSDDTQGVAGALSLQNVRESNWEQGLRAALEDNFIFVSPSVRGWSFVVGNALPSAPQPECLNLLTDLSLAFGEAQSFGAENVTESYSWAKALKGRLLRAYAFSGEQGAVLWDRGQLTEEENTLGLYFSEANILSNSPTSASVFQIAGRWSLDPTRLDELDCTPSTGLLGNY